MSAQSLASKSYSGLRDRLVKFTFIRVLIITLLLGSAIAVNVSDVESFSEPSYLTIFFLIITTYLATVIYAIWIRVGSRLSTLAFVQITGDTVLVGGLIFVTGGADSIFIFLFFLSIIPAATLRLRRGALYSASICSVIYTFIILSQNGHVPYFSHLSLVLGSSADISSYSALVHMFAFYTVAVLAGHLAETLGRFGTELELRWTDIRELRALNRNIINSIAEGLCTLNLADRIISFNRGAERITGVNNEEALGRHCIDVLPELARQFERLRKQGMVDSQANDLSFHRKGDPKPRVLGLSITPLRDAEGLVDGHILHFSDITEIRRLQERIQRQKRMAAIGQLSAGIAHEIRNPLASISGSIQVLKESIPNSAHERQLMDIVLREIDRLNSLIEDFLAYARPSRPIFAPLDVKGVLEDTLALLKQSTEQCRGCRFEWCLGPDIPPVFGDEDNLRQVFWNLVRNAVEAIEGEGTVGISLQAVESGSLDPGFVEIAISDTGCGVPPEDMAHLFEPFYTTKPNGTGLGLAIANRIIEYHGGMIFAEERKDTKGTIFRVRLPTEPPRPSFEEMTSSEPETMDPVGSAVTDR